MSMRRVFDSVVGRLAIIGTIVTFVGGILSVLPASPASAAPRPVTVNITSIEQIGTDVDPGPFQGPVGDFYAGVTINGTTLDNFGSRLNFPFEIGVGYIFPFSIPLNPPWTFTRTIDDASGTANVSIELWDNDDCDEPFCDDTGIFENNDDQVDISPSGSETLSLTVNLNDAKWTGDTAWPTSCVQGTGGEAVKICFEISTLSTSGDADSDGLLDAWEQHGFNGDGDGDIDVDLPAAGTNPNRKDLFVEIDCIVNDLNADGDGADAGEHSHCPQQNAMTDVVAAFANAPVPNPDSSNGIQLHLDTGPLYGAGVVSNVVGGVTGNVGDLGGGGTAIPEAGNTVIDWDGAVGNAGTSFYTLKTANFNAVRSQVFRYSIFGHQTNNRAAVNDCTSGWAEDIRGNDFFVTLGGGRDLDGNGTVDTTCWGPGPANGIDEDGDGATDEETYNNFDDDGDCAPGTDTDGDGNVCDFGDLGVNEDMGFSLGTRAEQAGTFMHELGHVLGLGHGGTDDVNNKPNYLSVMNYSFQSCSVPTSPAGAATPIPGNCDFSRFDIDLIETSLDECAGVNVGPGAGMGFGSNDWNGSGGLSGSTCPPPNTANVSTDINGDGMTNTLNGFDDWSNVFYSFQTLANFSNGVADPVQDEADPDVIEDAQRHLSEVMAPNVDLALSAPATILPGETINYTVDAASNGRGAAFDVSLIATRPDGSDAPFAIGDLVLGSTVQRAYSYVVPNDACPQTLTSTVDANYTNFVGYALSSTTSAATEVLDVTPPEITVTLAPNSLWPPNHTMRSITPTIVVTDECDPNPSVRLLSIASNEPDNGLGDGDTANDIQGATVGTDDRSFQLRAERAGSGSGRVYTVVYEATDASGNSATFTTTVVVPKS